MRYAIAVLGLLMIFWSGKPFAADETEADVDPRLNPFDTPTTNIVTLSCHLEKDNVVISLNPDDGSAFEHMNGWRGHFQVSEGAYRIWLDDLPDNLPKDFVSLEPPLLHLIIDRYSGRASAYWEQAGFSFIGNSQSCSKVEIHLF